MKVGGEIISMFRFAGDIVISAKSENNLYNSQLITESDLCKSDIKATGKKKL